MGDRVRRGIALGIVLASLATCLDPTEIVVALSTNVACDVVTRNEVAIAIGAPGDDDSGVATSTSLCASDGGVGTLVLIPSHGSADEVGIRVMLGIDASTESCTQPLFEHCIVARRSLRYDPHVPLRLPIDLEESCIGVHCDPTSTCSNGDCVDASTTCTSTDCNVQGGDASTPEGGPCVAHSDYTVATGSTQTSPRIALTNGGWAVAWVDGNGNVHAETLTPSANTVIASKQVNLGPSAGAPLGPLGSDGFDYALSFGGGTIVTAAADGGVPVTYLSETNDVGALGGMYFSGGRYATAFIRGTSQTPEFFTFPPPYGDAGGITWTNATSISLVQDGTTYYATVTDGTTCAVFLCTEAAGVFKCSNTPLNIQQRIGVRVAARGGMSPIIVTQGPGLVLKVASYPLVNVTPGEFTVLPTGPSYQVLWALNGQLGHTLYDGTNAPPTPTQLAATGNVFGFDAVADAPNQPGYAIAYQSITGGVTSIHFVHFCQ